ncbi:MAG: tRNA (uridine(34)/cytosine(34)/5-carboxymethylaminomethyluridine(34)-2'-O)-methyltransferase TrmL, partial [Deltaproteobacteria bacterium]|nr:tRNA (uridine(34)/cytosine(34)/5-carboxymethylaminomethyluridine(34)-2'-O)-methyltransferase TrmL [Deltaproteobacteria bacterium]
KLGFSLDDRQLKRAGLDYWPAVDVRQWDTLADMQQAHPGRRYWYTSKKAQKSYIEADFKAGDFLVFGKETMGLPESLLAGQERWTIRIPMVEGVVRSLNLATAAGIILYEARRQVG